MANQVSGSAGTMTPAGTPGPWPVTAPRPPRRRSWWPLAILASAVSLIAGAVVQHAVDQRSAGVSLYKAQINTTISRFLTEADRQLGRPVSQRSAGAFGDLADSIGQDPGVNGDSGALTVELGSGSVNPAGQIAFSVTVSSAHAGTTLVVWDMRVNGSSNEGVCALSSTLAGSGRVTKDVQLGGGEYLQPCESRWWSPGPVDGSQPRLSLAGIPESPRS